MINVQLIFNLKIFLPEADPPSAEKLVHSLEIDN